MILNYFPITFDLENYQIFSVSYSEERLSELRKKHNSTHSFFRNGDHIYISNKEGQEDSELGIPVEKNLYDDDSITSSLIKHIFFRTFKDRFPDRTPIDFYPFRFFSEKPEDDIINSLLPDDLKNKIAYKKMIELQLRKTEIAGKTRFGFIVNLKSNWILNINCETMYDEGFDLLGMDILHVEILPGLQNILAPNEEYIGTIHEIEGKEAMVFTNDGLQKYPLNKLILKKTHFNISSYLSFKLSESSSSKIFNEVRNKRRISLDAQSLNMEFIKIARALFTDKRVPILFQNQDGFCFHVSEDPLAVSNTIEIKTPTFIYDPAATKTRNDYPDMGLNNYGPYDSITFDIKSPKVLAICSGSLRGQFTNFLSNLRDGLPSSKWFQKGLQKKYDLQDVQFDIKELDSYNFEAYLEIIRNYEESRPDLAIIEIPDNFKKLDNQSNPYYKIKAKFLSLEIPVQFITTGLIKNHDEYKLNSIALQLYAKLGGTPWVLPSQRSVDREIVIGIGHSWIRNNEFKGSDKNRVVGITTFLSGDGQYLLGDRIKDVPFEEYFQELLKSLKNSIIRLSKEQAWNNGDTLRLIFHIFKPIKNTEFDVIALLISEFPEYNIKFAFVSISEHHPFILFDPSQNGINQYGKGLKGQFIPNRGSIVFIDSQTAIIQMLGAKELKTSKQGMSNPIQIKIRTPQGNHDNKELNNMLFYDLSYICQQVFSFTYLSWRSFLPGERPATMLYSNLISRLLSKMRNIPGWDPDKLNYSMKRKKWFL
ncbi:Piwi domain-containing protein [Marinoscillum pacificum]|uniref:Piwi domain-containing protein n=1 Tax=Marinoscillum pacificum TaxID=392723 RepID=UPI0021573E92|nr:Piwi domain-containing protein [Marinoscillum pacificum]